MWDIRIILALSVNSESLCHGLRNNEFERLLRTPVVARRNYYGSGAEWSGHLAAMTWTLWMAAAQNGHDPSTYLADYLTAYAHNGYKPLSPKALAVLLPAVPSAVSGVDSS